MAQEIILFSVEEANALLPHIRKTLAHLRRLWEQLHDIRGKQEVLHLIHGSKVTHAGNPDREEWQELTAQAEALAHEFHAHLDSIQEKGAVVKDVEHGLVDFYSERDGEIVFLCWREGEPTLQYWHPLSTGFAGRQRLSDAESSGPDYA